VRAATAQGLPVVGAIHADLELLSAVDVDASVASVASVAPAAMVLATVNAVLALGKRQHRSTVGHTSSHDAQAFRGATVS